jgi:hypothetical protein
MKKEAFLRANVLVTRIGYLERQLEQLDNFCKIIYGRESESMGFFVGGDSDGSCCFFSADEMFGIIGDKKNRIREEIEFNEKELEEI